MNAPRFAGQVEKSYRKMWQTWCAGQKMERTKVEV